MGHDRQNQSQPKIIDKGRFVLVYIHLHAALPTSTPPISAIYQIQIPIQILLHFINRLNLNNHILYQSVSLHFTLFVSDFIYPVRCS
ncbi:hypothetical protein QVD17_02736 [Tagetes erecta]|uniref:Uncharacterized protein n=1 Tax=Tagetes erecta TaxID=13708 RepID=A0AAD8P9B9_TARER|nr:hypothetical protein QVD17_02736 [Tagetes erecta]